MYYQSERVFIRQASFTHPNSRIEGFVSGHPFNAILQIFRPFQRSRTTTVSVLEASPRFTICRARLTAFLSDCFLLDYVYCPAVAFYAVSVGLQSDLTDSFCLFDNVLRLSLTSSTYACLGLSGRHSTQTKDRYIVDIKLDSESIKQKKSYYHKVKDRLQSIEKDFLIWNITMKNDVLTEFDSSLPGFSEIRSEKLRYSSWTLRPKSVPQLSPREPQYQGSLYQPEHLQTIADWFGALSNGISDYVALNSDENPGYRVHCEKWTGMLSSTQIWKAIEWGKTQLQENGLPWIAVTVTGFKDTPLSFKPCKKHETTQQFDFDELFKVDHAVLDDTSGQNEYLLLILPSSRYVLYVFAGAGDTFTTL